MTFVGVAFDGNDDMFSSMTGTAHSRTRAMVFAVALIGLVSIAGCAGESDDTSSRPSNPGTTNGAALYKQVCASCHGVDLKGTDRGPSHLSQVYAPDHHTDESFRAAVRQGARAHHWGFGDMPAIGGIDDAQLDAIIAYVREQQTQHGLEPYPPG